MDKEEYRVRLETIRTLADEGDFKAASSVADTVDWKRVKSVRTLCMIGEIYEANGRFEDTRRILEYAYWRTSISKTVLYRLTEINIRIGDFEGAQKYCDEFEIVSPKDPTKYLLRYKLMSARKDPLGDQIRVLEDYKDEEFTERWGWELAKLYQENGDNGKCIALCDEIILWFAEGKYVTRAMELKTRVLPLAAQDELAAYAGPEEDAEADEAVYAEDAEYAEEAESAGAAAYAGEEEGAEEKDTEPDDGYTPAGYETTPDDHQGYDYISRPEAEAAGLSDVLSEIEEEERLAKQEAEERAERRRGGEKERRGGLFGGAKLADSIRAVFASLRSGGTADDEDEEEDEEERVRSEIPVRVTDRKEEVHVPQLEPETDSEIRIEAETEDLEEQITLASYLDDTMSADTLDIDAYLAETSAGMASEIASGQYASVNEIPEEAAEQMYGEETVYAEPEYAEETAYAEEEYTEEDAEPAYAEEAAEPEYAEEAAEPEYAEEGAEPEYAEEAAAPEYDAEADENLEPYAAYLEDITIPAEGDVDLDQLMAAAEAYSAGELPEETEEEIARIADEGEEETVWSAEETEEAAEDWTAELTEEEIAAEEPEVIAEAEEETADAAEEEAAEEETAEEETAEEYAEEAEPADLEEEALADQSEQEELDPLEKLYGRETDESLGLTQTFSFSEELKKAWARIRSSLTESEAARHRRAVNETLKSAGVVTDEEEPEEVAAEETEAEYAEEDAETEEAVKAVEEAEESAEEEAEEPSLVDILEEEPERFTFQPVEPRAFDETEKEIFTYFTKIPGMREQITTALADVHNNTGDKTSRSGNIMIIGRPGAGKTRLSDALMVSICRDLGITAARAAHLTAEAMNEKNPAEVIAKLAGGFLLIEDAGSLSDETVARLLRAMEFRTDDLVVMLEDEKADLKTLLGRHPEIEQKFTSTIVIPVFTNDELVTFARTYAREKGYRMDEMGILALYTMIGDNQTATEPVTVGRVKEMMDAAISRADTTARKIGRRFSKRAVDKDGRILLHERDFDF